MRDEERGYVLLSHLFTAIPLWGILFNGILWIIFQERNKRVVFHAHQGIFFQVTFLAMLLLGLIVSLFAQLVGGINRPIAYLIQSGNLIIITTLFVVYEITCLYAIWNVIQGRDFEYPFIGKKLRENTQNLPPKDSE